jgi:O-acetyl-ADP-ribose deacetylase (regulator of RNase III)
MITKIVGNIIEFKDAQYIAHQCNCLSRTASGLAENLFKAFPWADIYSERTPDYKPENGKMAGDIVICGDGDVFRYVINMMGQVYPGRPKFPESKLDGYSAREKHFKACLAKISRIKGLKSIAFPDHIGCGLAGGNWDNYLNMIYLLDETWKKNKEEKEIYIVKVED